MCEVAERLEQKGIEKRIEKGTEKGLEKGLKSVGTILKTICFIFLGIGTGNSK